MNTLLICIVRLMPSRLISCGRKPVMSRSRKNTRPLSGFNRPEIRLNSVVLPAPFGPMMACNRPPGRLRLRLSVAVRPPNFFVRFSVRRIASTHGSLRNFAGTGSIARGAVMRSSASRHRPTMPLRRKDDREDRQRADDQRMMLPMRRNHLANDDEQCRADNRAEQRSRAADDSPYQPFARNVVEHVGCRGVAAEERKQRAGNAGQKARHDKRGEAHQIDIEADQRGPTSFSRTARKALPSGLPITRCIR